MSLYVTGAFVISLASLCTGMNIIPKNFKLVKYSGTITKGDPYYSFSARSNVECGKFCAGDCKCKTYTSSKLHTGGYECDMYTLLAVTSMSAQEAVRTYVIKGKFFTLSHIQ